MNIETRIADLLLTRKPGVFTQAEAFALADEIVRLPETPEVSFLVDRRRAREVRA